MQTPVVLIVFNRPDFTRRVFERVRAARPEKLLVISDGPRAGHPTDVERVAASRKIIEYGVDWPCELLTDYAGENVGCMDRIRSGIDSAFEQFEEAVILEDDCLPDVSFFSFCDEILDRYRHDERVMTVSGTNFISQRYVPKYSYWFSRHACTWGWATWRRAWRNNDFEMATWEAGLEKLRASFATSWEREYWMATFEQARQDLRGTNCWDYQWHFTCRSLGGVTVIPRTNLVENLGFEGGGTHVFGNMERLMAPVQEIGAIAHPPAIKLDPYADELWTRVYAGSPLTMLGELKSRLRIWKDSLSARRAA